MYFIHILWIEGKGGALWAILGLFPRSHCTSINHSTDKLRASEEESAPKTQTYRETDSTEREIKDHSQFEGTLNNKEA